MTPHFAECRLTYPEAALIERLLREYILEHTEHDLCDQCNADLLLEQQHTPTCPVNIAVNVIYRIAFASEVK